MDIELRHSLTVEDYNAIRRSVEWKEIPEEQAKRGLSNTYYLTAAFIDGQPVGMARLISDGGYVAYIADVVVNQNYQGHGIGRIIMNDIMDYIKKTLSSQGETVMVILVAVKGKEEFYEKFGFIKRPNEQFGAGMTLWL